jgi:NADH dehydrogenase
VATGILSEGEVAPPIRDILRHHANATVLLGEVVDIDVDARLLVVDAGAIPSSRRTRRG